MRRALALALTSIVVSMNIAACNRVRLRPGTGGVRVHVRGAGSRGPVHVWIAPPVTTGVPWTALHVLANDGDALFVDVPEGFYRIAIADEEGHGGYYGSWGGNSSVRVRAGEITRESITLSTGVSVRGRVVDASTGAPLANVSVAPPTRAASQTWPVALPWFWSASLADGSFLLAGLPAPTESRSGPSTPIWFERAGYVTQSLPLPSGGASGWTVSMQPAVPAPTTTP